MKKLLGKKGVSMKKAGIATERVMRMAVQLIAGKDCEGVLQKLEDSDSADDSSENDTKLAGRLKKNN